jgi:hypothetical protein
LRTFALFAPSSLILTGSPIEPTFQLPPQGSAAGQLRGPRGVAVDGLGDLGVADTGNNRLQEFTFAGGFIQRLGRNSGDGAPGEFSTP